VQQVIAKETQKMNAQADAVKEVRTKASSRVVDYRIHRVSSEEQSGQGISRASLETSGNIGGCH
jgi:hypothetical protein